MGLTPICLKLLAREVRPAVKWEYKLDHDVSFGYEYASDDAKRTRVDSVMQYVM